MAQVPIGSLVAAPPGRDRVRPAAGQQRAAADRGPPYRRHSPAVEFLAASCHPDAPPRRTSPIPPEDIFEAIWSSQQRNIAEGPEPRTNASPESRLHSADSKSPPLAPGQPAACPSPRPAPIEPGPLPILRAGVIQQMAYTLFADGSIEAQASQGVMRFASIEEFLGHLEKGED